MEFRRSWRFRLLAGAAVGLMAVLFVASPAVAGDEERALEIAAEANDYYDDGQFADALRLYREAYDILDDERLLYRIGLSYEHVGNYRRARQFLEKYLELDEDSPVRGRIEATIDQAAALEESVQPMLIVDSEPEGAEIYTYGYMGESVGTTPAEIPVGSGETQITLDFAEGQRLEVFVEVGAGETEERFFQVGTGAPVARDGEGREVASEEMAAVEAPVDEEVTEDPPVEDEEVDAPPEDVDDEEVAEEEDVIPTPEDTADRDLRQTRIDYVDASPPWWANTLGVIGIVGGHGVMTLPLYEDLDVPAIPAVVTGLLMVGGSVYLLGRNWRSGLPEVDARQSQRSDEVARSQPEAPTGAEVADEAGIWMFQWGTSF